MADDTDSPFHLDYVFVRCKGVNNGNPVRVSYADIQYAKANGDYCILSLAKPEKPMPQELIVPRNLSQVEPILVNKGFVRIHRGHIVNRARIATIEEGTVILDSGHTLPISQQYETKFREGTPIL